MTSNTPFQNKGGRGGTKLENMHWNTQNCKTGHGNTQKYAWKRKHTNHTGRCPFTTHTESRTCILHTHAQTYMHKHIHTHSAVHRWLLGTRKKAAYFRSCQPGPLGIHTHTHTHIHTHTVVHPWMTSCRGKITCGCTASWKVLNV